MSVQEYENKQPVKVVTKRDLTVIGFWRSQFLQSGFSYVKMQGVGWAYALIPVLKKIHTNPEDFKKSLKMHLEFYNNNPFVAPFVMGVVLAMEEAKESIDLIRGVKLATMGPGGGIGDALTWFTLLPITVCIGSSMALSGSVAGPFVFLILFNLVIFGLRYFLVHYGYKTGLKAVTNIKNTSAAISHGASIVGATVIGGLIASFVNVKTAAVLHLHKVSKGAVGYDDPSNMMNINIQTDVLDKIMPGLLPLAVTLLFYYGLKKSIHPVTLIIISIVVAILGKWIGVL